MNEFSLNDLDLMPPPDEVAAEIVERLETALDRFHNLARHFAEADMSEVTPANAPALSDDRAKILSS